MESKYLWVSSQSLKKPLHTLLKAGIKTEIIIFGNNYVLRSAEAVWVQHHWSSSCLLHLRAQRRKESLWPPVPKLHCEHWQHILSCIFVDYFSTQAHWSLTMHLPRVSLVLILVTPFTHWVGAVFQVKSFVMILKSRRLLLQCLSIEEKCMY